MSGKSQGSNGRQEAAWGAWVAFVAVMMVLVGIFSVLAGLAAVTDSGFITKVTASGETFIFSTTALGVFWLLLGVLLGWTGVALIQGQAWARGVTVLLAGIHTVVDLLTLSVHPFLSLLFIAINILIIYGVTVRWELAKAGMGD